VKAGAKMGRPPLSPDGSKAATFSMRLLPGERSAVDAAARRAGLGASEWARRVLVAAASAEAEENAEK